MEDETKKGLAGASNQNNQEGKDPRTTSVPNPAPEPQSAEPEPVILEEHITQASVRPTPIKIPPVSMAATPSRSVPPSAAVEDVSVTEVTRPQESPSENPLETPSAPPSIAHDSMEDLLKSIKLPERREFKGGADRLQTPIAPTPVVPTPPQQESAPAKEELPPERDIVTPLRTLKDDLQTVVRDQKISLVRAVSLEQEKKKGQEHLAPEQREIRERRSKRTAAMLFSIFLLVFVGVAAFFGVAYVMQQRAAVSVLPDSSILFSEQTVALPLSTVSPQTLKAQIAQEVSQPLGSLGSITRILPVIQASSTGDTPAQSPATFAQFMSAIGAHPPDELMRAVGPDFFFGIHVVDKNAPMFVIDVSSYDHAFAGMLAWEATMNTDLTPIFPYVTPVVAGTNGVPQPRTFQDEILRNYDIRALVDDQGNVQLYYSFPTPKILVIAQSPYSFPEILSRLQAERKL